MTKWYIIYIIFTLPQNLTIHNDEYFICNFWFSAKNSCGQDVTFGMETNLPPVHYATIDPPPMFEIGHHAQSILKSLGMLQCKDAVLIQIWKS